MCVFLFIHNLDENVIKYITEKIQLYIYASIFSYIPQNTCFYLYKSKNNCRISMVTDTVLIQNRSAIEQHFYCRHNAQILHFGCREKHWSRHKSHPLFQDISQDHWKFYSNSFFLRTAAMWCGTKFSYYCFLVEFNLKLFRSKVNKSHVSLFKYFTVLLFQSYFFYHINHFINIFHR